MVAKTCRSRRFYFCAHICASNLVVKNNFGTKQLVAGYISVNLCCIIAHFIIRVAQIFRTDAHDYGLSIVTAVNQLLCFCRRQSDREFIKVQCNVRTAYLTGRIDKVHLRRTDKSSYE